MKVVVYDGVKVVVNYVYGHLDLCPLDIGHIDPVALYSRTGMSA